MYLLKMHIGRLLIDKEYISLAGTDSAEQRAHRLQLLAIMMYWKNIRSILMVRQEPAFFLDNVPSKMNDLTIFEERMFLQEPPDD